MKLFIHVKILFYSIFPFIGMVIFALLISSCKPEEKPDPLSSLDISGNLNACRKGDTIHLKSQYNPHSGMMPDFSWESSNKNVLIVKNDGTAIALDSGKVIVTLRVNDGTGLTSSKAIYVFGKPSVSITSVTDITYFSANFSVQSDFGGGNSTNTTCGLIWDTVPKLNIAKQIGKTTSSSFLNKTYIDFFDYGKKYYVSAYIKTPLDTVYSENMQVSILSLPVGTLGNYMLNIPLAYGDIAKNKDWIYYANRTDNNKIYRIKDNLSFKEKLSDKSGIFSINIIGSNLYFGQFEDKKYSYVNKSKLDGSGIQKVIPGNEIATYGAFQMQDSNIFYSNRNDFRINVNGTNKLQLDVPDALFFNIYKNKLYFILEKVDKVDSLCSINESSLDGKIRREIYRGYNLGKIGVYEDAIYFAEKQIMKKIDLINQSPIQVLPINTANFNIYNYTIYFSNKEDTNKLYKSDLGGLLINKINDDNVGIISIIDDWLYYYTTDNHLYRIKQDGSNRQLVD